MNTTRRGFMKTALAAGAFPFLPGCATFGRDKVRVACVGVGNRASEVIKCLEKTGLYEFVALCDTDLEGEQCANVLGRYPTLPRFTDFRKMLDAVGGRIAQSRHIGFSAQKKRQGTEQDRLAGACFSADDNQILREFNIQRIDQRIIPYR